MLRVECESCHAPYQVDERRVPPQGLKMRCPKCGHTFSVTKPATEGDDALPALRAPKAPPPKPAAAAPADLPAVRAGGPPRPGPPRPPPPVPQRPAAPTAAAPPKPDLADLPAPRQKQSSLPAALGSIDNFPPVRRPRRRPPRPRGSARSIFPPSQPTFRIPSRRGSRHLPRPMTSSSI